MERAEVREPNPAEARRHVLGERVLVLPKCGRLDRASPGGEEAIDEIRDREPTRLRHLNRPGLPEALFFERMESW